MSKVNWQLGLVLFLAAFMPACKPFTANTAVTAAQTDPNPTSTIAATIGEEGSIYLWPTYIPDGVKINAASSFADHTGFLLELVDGDGKISIRILGEYVAGSDPCPKDLEKVSIRNVEACYAPSSDTGYVLQWPEHGMHFLIGGINTSRELDLKIAQSLEEVDIETWKERLRSAQQ